MTKEAKWDNSPSTSLYSGCDFLYVNESFRPCPIERFGIVYFEVTR